MSARRSRRSRGSTRTRSLFSRDITAIDLRLPGRLTVRLSEDAAKARADMLKDKEKARKKKANEA